MSAFVAPITHGQTESVLGDAYKYAENLIRERLVESFEATGEGLVVGWGDLAGTGTDTLRITHWTGLGYAEEFQAMAAENDEPTATGFEADNDTASLARYALAKDQTYQSAILAGPVEQAIFGLDKLAVQIPRSLSATIRSLLGAQVGTFSDSIGDTGVAWTMDHELQMVASFRETDGYDPRVHGLPVALRAPAQLTQLRDSVRNEPAFQDPAIMQAINSLGGEAGGGFSFLGIRNIGSGAVGTSGGDYLGGAYLPGAVGIVVASGRRAPVQDPASTIYLDEWGLIIEHRSRPGPATATFTANAWVGMAKRSALVFPQKRIRSVV